MINLYKIGWNEFFHEQFEKYKIDGFLPARITGKHKNSYELYYEKGWIQGELSGKFRYKAVQKKDFPSVGDWVTVQIANGENKAIIYALLPRKTSFVRKPPISGGRKIKNGMIVGGSIEEQVIASNIDTAFIVTGLDGNFNLQRIERYVTLVCNSGAVPVILLNKMDLCNNISDYVRKVENIALGLKVHPVSVTKQLNMDIFTKYLLPGKTIVFIGSSGVGKSTIINYLTGEEKLQTHSVSSATGKGMHTTTSAELVFTPAGSMIIDTPGLRELQLWGNEEVLDESFEDISNIALNCKYRDCHHDTEPGCAVKLAVSEGLISPERFASYMKQLKELQQLSKNKREFEKNFNRKMKNSL